MPLILSDGSLIHSYFYAFYSLISVNLFSYRISQAPYPV